MLPCLCRHRHNSLATNASPYPTIAYKHPPFTHFVTPLSAPFPSYYVSGCFSSPPASSPSLDLLMVLQQNAGGLCARSSKLFHFISLQPVDLICIKKLNHNSSSTFRIVGYSSIRSDHNHSWSIIIFISQGLSFSELSTSPLSLLGLHLTHQVFLTRFA